MDARSVGSAGQASQAGADAGIKAGQGQGNQAGQTGPVASSEGQTQPEARPPSGGGTRRPDHLPNGFTLVELLVVIVIIGLVSAAVIPPVVNALGQRKVGEAARILQAALIGARDSAIHNDEPRGIRLLPDPSLTSPPLGSLGAGGVPIAGTSILAYNRFVPIEPAPDYSDGRVDMHDNWLDPRTSALPVGYLIIWQATLTANPNVSTTFYQNPPTSWYWNIRVGDKFQFKNSGRVYTVIGPMAPNFMLGTANPEGFVNVGAPGTLPPSDQYGTPNGGGTNPEYLYLVNGVDDDGDGYIDDGWDGINNNLDANNLIDYILDPSELEQNESWLGDQKLHPVVNSPYVINRRPTVSQGARETSLPGGVVIDATTWQNRPSAERSRLPVDANTLYVDVMIQPNGQVVPNLPYSNPAILGLADAFYHFWITDRTDVHEPMFGVSNAGVVTQNPNVGSNPPQAYTLPLPEGTLNSGSTTGIYMPPANTPGNFLTGERRLVTLFARSGGIVTNEVEPASLVPASPAPPQGTGFPAYYTTGFLGNGTAGNSTLGVNNPYVEAQLGMRASK